MAETKLTLGQAIDQIISALQELGEEARITAVTAACKHLNIVLSQPAQYRAPAGQVSGVVEHIAPGIQPAHSGHKVDIRTLTEQKKPSSAQQMACIVAYYLQELAPDNERKDTVSSQDIEKFFKQAKFKLPKAVGQVLKDAKQSGYFESVARGEYKLNAVGYNLVVHGLPSKKES